MGEQEELAAWAAARWPTLVRVALALGAPAPVAVEVATDALARLRPRWRSLRTQGDPDADALDLLLAAWRAACAARWWERHPAESPARPDPLDALARDQRADLVLAQLGDVGGDPPATGLDPARWQALRTATVFVPAPTSARLDEIARRRRRRQGRQWTGRALAVALVIAVVLGVRWTSARPGAPDLREPRALSRVEVAVRGSTGSAPVSWLTWYADGRLHLGASVARLAGVQQVVGVSGGAVYVDAAGRVVSVTTTGDRTLLGRTDDALSLVASDDGDRVGWIDARGGRHLVVADPADGQGRRTLALPSGAEDGEDQLVALGNGRVYVTGPAGSWSRPVAGGAPSATVDATLLAVAGDLAVYAPTADGAAVRAARLDPTGELPSPERTTAVPGEEATLAPDAGYVLTRSVSGEVVIQDLTTGRDLPTGVRGGEVALAATLGRDGRVAYVVARAADRPRGEEYVRASFTGPATVRTCVFARDLVTITCVPVDQVSGTSGNPLLAH